MRHLLLAILITLLPLRTWAGDAMAIQMAAEVTVPATATQAPHVDCPEHAAAAVDAPAPDTTPGSDGHCNTCSACQACSAVAFILPDMALALPPQLHSVPSWAAAHFTSADPAPGQKPPIS